MNHRFLEDRLFLYIDGDLPSEDQTRCEEHLRTCPRCRERVDALRATWNSDTLMRVSGPTLRLRTRFEAALRGEAFVESGPAAGTKLDWLGRPALMAATLAVGIVIGAYLGSGPNGETAQVETPAADSNVLAFSFAEDLQDVTAESVGQEYLLLDWDAPMDDPGR